MRFIIFLFLFLIYNKISAQHSERFTNLTLNLKHTDSSYIKNYYRDGTLKEKGAKLYYNMPEYNYSKKYGLWLEYYKTGTIKTKSEYDKLGNLLNRSLYDLQGSISSDLNAVLIDSKILDYHLF